jgi:hypothetical protein
MKHPIDYGYKENEGAGVAEAEGSVKNKDNSLPSINQFTVAFGL